MIVTLYCSCLRAIRMLQRNGHIPSDPSLFKTYAQYGHFVDVRIAALEAVVDYTRGTEWFAFSSLCFHFCVVRKKGLFICFFQFEKSLNNSALFMVLMTCPSCTPGLIHKQGFIFNI